MRSEPLAEGQTLIAIAALDVRDGACAQLEGGAYAALRAQFGDPATIARSWADLGFGRLHVADLNAAVAHGSNEQIIDEVLRATAPLDVQVSGGVATSDRIEQLVRAGATSVVLGARALEDPDWLSAQASLYPRVLIVATDVRTQRVAIAGWVRTLKIDIVDVVAELSTLALAGVLVSGLRLAGEMRGPDLALLEDVAAAAKVPVLAAGGIATMADLRALENRGIAGAVVGAALYTGVLDARMVAQEFGE